MKIEREIIEAKYNITGMSEYEFRLLRNALLKAIDYYELKSYRYRDVLGDGEKKIVREFEEMLKEIEKQ